MTQPTDFDLPEGEYFPDWSQYDRQAEEQPDYLKVGLLLGAGFLVWRKLVTDRLPVSIEPNQISLLSAVESAVTRLGPLWLKLTVPHIKRAYELGAHAQLDEEELNYLATVYAEKLGEYVHQTSSEALVEGYNALINQRWSPQIAYQRAKEGFGLNSAQMRTYILSMENLDRKYAPNDLTDDPKVKSVLTKLLSERSVSIGENEAYTVQNLGQQIRWMKAEKDGLLPKGVRKVWYTAKDERVCPICAPMNHASVDLGEQFEVKERQYWGPALHPNCRCRVELIYDTEGISKAWEAQEHPRGGNPKNRGQFSSTWGSRNNTVDRANFDTVADQILADALKEKPKTLKVFNPNRQFKTLKTLDTTKQFKTAASATYAPKIYQPKSLNTSAWQKARQELHLPKAMRVYFHEIAAEKSPLYRAPTQAEPERRPYQLFGYAMTTNNYYVGDKISFEDDNYTQFVDNQNVAFSLADDQWLAIGEVVAQAIDTDPRLGQRFTDEFLYYEFHEAMSEMSDQDIEYLADVFNVSYPSRDDTEWHIASIMVKPWGHPDELGRGEDHHIHRVIDEFGVFGRALQHSYDSIMIELLENHQPEFTEHAHHLLPHLFPGGLTEDGATNITMPHQVVYVIEEPRNVEIHDREVVAGEDRSLLYRPQGEYTVIDHETIVVPPRLGLDVTHLELIILRPEEDFSKKLDPFGVVHLSAVK